METESERPWDAIVLGGALSGAATALQLLRRNCRLRVLVLERSPRFTRRVGESTVEVSSYFLGRALGLTEHLNDRHLVKQGMRFWFANDRATNLAECSETGPAYNVRLPGYQVDRAVLDEEVLARARAAGAQLRRPVRIRRVDLPDPAATGPATATVYWQDEHGQPAAATARWVVDATGVAALLARQEGWLEINTAHPTAAIWSRWSGVLNWDGPELAARYPSWSRRTRGTRYTATNHLVGRGWWAWVIPLKGGDVSLGVVFDQRMVDLTPGERLGERLRAMLCTHPVGRELLAEATFHEGDVHFRRNLAYRSRVMAGQGFVLVGDAAGFIDPFYSPGMDWISYTTTAAAALIDAACRGRPMAERIARHNERFGLSYDRWFDAVYRDKYYYMGDWELMTLAFRLDLGLYYLGVVSQPFRRGPQALETPSFAGEHTRWPYRIVAHYNRRLSAIARDRWRRGVWGRRNDRRYHPFNSYRLDWTLPLRVAKAFGAYAALELREGWRTWFGAPAPVDEIPAHASRERPRAAARPHATPPVSVAAASR